MDGLSHLGARTLVCVTAAVSSCGGGGGGSSSSGAGSGPLAVTATSPVQGATAAEPGAPIEIAFSAPIDPASVSDASFQVFADAEPIAGSRDVVGVTVSFAAAGALPLLGSIRVEVSGDLRDVAGRPLGGAFSLAFDVRDGEWSTASVLQSGLLVAGLAPVPGGGHVALLLGVPAPLSDLASVDFDPATGWSAPATLFGDDSVTFAAIATDASGEAAIVASRWSGGGAHEMWATTRGAGEAAWAPPQSISPPAPGFSSPAAAFPSAGVPIAVWRVDGAGEVQAAAWDAEEGWSEPQTLSSAAPGAGAPAVAANGTGAALCVWTEDGGTEVWSCRFVVGLGWEAPRLVHDNFACCVSDPRVALGPGGDALVVWGDAGAVYASRLASPAGDWQEPEALDLQGCPTPVAGEAVSLGASGTGLVVWVCGGALWSARFDGAGWESAELIEPLGAVTPTSPRVALDPTGNVIVVWDQEPPLAGGPRSVWARRHIAAEGWQPALALHSVASLCAVAPRVAIGVDGRGLAVWNVTTGCDFAQGVGTFQSRFD